MRTITLTVVLLILISCSVSQVVIYRLHLPEPTNTKDTKNSEANAFITVKSYRHLEQPYIVTKTSQYELTTSIYAKWDSSPVEMVKEKTVEYLTKSGLFAEIKTERLSRKDNPYFISIMLKDFSRLETGSKAFGMLAFSVWLRDPQGRVLYSRDFQRQQPLNDSNYLSLAEALSVALAESLSELGRDLDRVLQYQFTKDSDKR